jgi:hypothetical protein
MIKTAVHSFFNLGDTPRLTPGIEYWALSYACARQTIGKVVLVGDAAAQEQLKNIPYDARITVPDSDLPRWLRRGGSVCKLVAYKYINFPFAHIDGDGFQWKPLPKAALTAPWYVLGVNHFHIPKPPCMCGYWDGVKYSDPRIERWFNTEPHLHCAFGTVGGNNWQAFHEAARIGMRACLDAFDSRPAGSQDWIAGMSFEEYIGSRYLWNTLGPPAVVQQGQAWSPADARLSGHTHMIGMTKLDPKNGEAIRRKNRIVWKQLGKTPHPSFV